jgi:large subunit ribosomal protein L25
VGDASIRVEIREGTGKQFNRRLRVSGRVPAVVYGFGHQNVMLSIDPADLEREIKTSHAGINTLFDLEGEDSVAGRTVIVKELQREPVRGGIVHADFFEVNPERAMQFSIPVRIEGSAPGVVMGGVIEHTLREIEIECLPSAIPDDVIANVDGLEVGDSLHVSDLSLPAGIIMVSDATLSVVSVITPKGVVEEEEAAAEGEEVVEGEEGEAAAEGEEKAKSDEDGED